MKTLEIHEERYKNFLTNKKVAIVGPSESAFFRENGKYIDSFDIVVRINRGIEMVNGNGLFIGSRTDILYNSLDFVPSSGGTLNGLTDEVKFICCPYSIEEHTYRDSNVIPIFDKFNIRFINSNIYNKLKFDTDSRVSSGFGAIVDLLQFDIEQLFVTGIDFYRSLYHRTYPSQVNNMALSVDAIEKDLEFKIYDDNRHHNPDRQYAKFKEIASKDARVKLDPFLKKITKDSSYDNWDTIPRN
jgi:hypothetical protein